MSLTDSQRIKLGILQLVYNDADAVKTALTFIADDQLKYELFVSAWNALDDNTPATERADAATTRAAELAELFS